MRTDNSPMGLITNLTKIEANVDVAESPLIQFHNSSDWNSNDDEEDNVIRLNSFDKKKIETIDFMNKEMRNSI